MRKDPPTGSNLSRRYNEPWPSPVSSTAAPLRAYIYGSPYTLRATRPHPTPTTTSTHQSRHNSRPDPVHRLPPSLPEHRGRLLRRTKSLAVGSVFGVTPQPPGHPQPPPTASQTKPRGRPFTRAKSPPVRVVFPPLPQHTPPAQRCPPPPEPRGRSLTSVKPQPRRRILHVPPELREKTLHSLDTSDLSRFADSALLELGFDPPLSARQLKGFGMMGLPGYFKSPASTRRRRKSRSSSRSAAASSASDRAGLLRGDFNKSLPSLPISKSDSDAPLSPVPVPPAKDPVEVDTIASSSSTETDSSGTNSSRSSTQTLRPPSNIDNTSLSGDTLASPSTDPPKSPTTPTAPTTPTTPTTPTQDASDDLPTPLADAHEFNRNDLDLELAFRTIPNRSDSPSSLQSRSDSPVHKLMQVGEYNADGALRPPPAGPSDELPPGIIIEGQYQVAYLSPKTKEITIYLKDGTTFAHVSADADSYTFILCPLKACRVALYSSQGSDDSGGDPLPPQSDDAKSTSGTSARTGKVDVSFEENFRVSRPPKLKCRQIADDQISVCATTIGPKSRWSEYSQPGDFAGIDHDIPPVPVVSQKTRTMGVGMMWKKLAMGFKAD